MPIVPLLGEPRVSVANHAPAARVFRQVDFMSGLAGGKVIDSANARDPGNTGNSGWLRPGLFMGKVASTKKYANSIIDVLNGALTSVGTTLTLTAAGVIEVVRRLGATGTLTLFGPPVANGIARALTATYSAASGTSVTITALGVNCVQTIAVDTIMSAGSIGLTAYDSSGVKHDVKVAYDTSWTQTVADIQTALIAKLGTSAVACAVTNTHDMTVTFSGTGYAAFPQPIIGVNIISATGPTKVDVTMTTPGVDGRFVSGAFVQAADGSQTPLTLLPDGWNYDIIDMITSSAVDIPFQNFPIAGIIETGQLPLWPTDTSLQAYLETSLNTNGQFVFDSAF